MQHSVKSWVLSLVLLAGGDEVRAQLKADPASVDLGRQKQEQTVSTEVKLTNPGATPVVITATTADCSCTVAKPERDHLAPGESTLLRLSVKTQSYQGALRRVVRVQTSAGELTIPIDLTVIAYEHWTVLPATIVMPPGQRGSESLTHATLNYTGEGKAGLGKLTSTPDYIEVTTATQDGRKFDLTFKKRPDAPGGNHSIKVTLETTDTVDPRVSIHVFLPNAADSSGKADAAGDSPAPKVALRVIPTPIVLPTVTVGQRSVREITLQGWTSKAEPRLTLNRGQVKLLSRQAGEMHYEVSLTPAMPGPFNGVLRVFDGERLLFESVVILRAEPQASGK